MAAERPDRYTANMAKRDRQGRIYVDYLRNGRGATAVGAYSTRARPGAAVSTPLSWDELGPAIRSNHFTLANLSKRLAFLDADPWEGFLSLRQNLPAPTAKPAKRAAPRPAGDVLPDAVVPPKVRLVAYWQKVAKHALPALARRPLRLVRHENGVVFWHSGPLPALPDVVHQIPIRNAEGGEDIWPWVDSLDGLLGLVEIGAIELHPWSATVDDIERPDTLVFAVEGTSQKLVVEPALKLRDVLRGEDLECWPLLTGAQGLHVVAPVEPDLDWQEMRHYSQSIAERVAGVNVRCNGRGATRIGAWSPRACRGFPVAAPVSWPALQRGIAPDAFTLTRPPKPSRSS
jgi:bifunctional non-homologous end joining protein LigD